MMILRFAAIASCCFVLAFGQTASAIKIVGDDPVTSTFDAKKHDRFYEGFDKEFIGTEIDLSGVARGKNASNGKYVTWITMISNTHFVTSEHFHVGNSTNWPITFYREDRIPDPSENDYDWEGFAEASFQIANSDLRVGKLTSAPPPWVKRYPLLKRPETLNYVGLAGVNPELFVIGKDHGPNPVVGETTNTVRVGRNNITGQVRGDKFDDHPQVSNSNGYIFQDESAFLIDGAITQGGDSGGPSFVNLHGGTTAQAAALAGIHSRDARDVSISSELDNIISAVNEPLTIVTDLLGDINNDFYVDSLDLGPLLNSFNLTNVGYNDGDLNNSGVVNNADLALLLNNLGKSLRSPADFNEDFVLDAADFDVIATHWNQTVAVPYTNGDANGDSYVDEADITTMNETWFLTKFTYDLPAPPFQVPGDMTNDGFFTSSDYTTFLDMMGQSVVAGSPGDFNNNGTIDGNDLAQFLLLYDDGAGTKPNVVPVDINEDKRVDLLDLQFLTDNWLRTDVLNGVAEGDLNLDGKVDNDDLRILGSYWNYGVSGENVIYSSIPEPSTLLLSVLATGWLTTSRQHLGRARLGEHIRPRS